MSGSPLRTPAPAALLLATLPLCAVQCAGPAPASGPATAPGARQILWQRSLADALALARAEERPLFVAVNMDGESASERIVRENYRDERFVASTRHCVCVVASLFRHNARDHDAQGRRIPCPRLGCVTCGEHIALEPVLFAELLHGERVAPRHALFLPDGTRAWDNSLVFDLRDLDGLMAASAKAHGGGAAPARPPAAGWTALAAARDAKGRSGFEQALGAVDDPEDLAAALTAVRTAGDAGSIEALRLAVHRLVALHPDHAAATAGLRDALVAAARAHDLAPAVAAAVRERLAAIDALPDGFAPRPAEVVLLPLLAQLDGASPATRSAVLARCAVASAQGSSDGKREALRLAFGAVGEGSIDRVVSVGAGAVDLAALHRLAAAVTGSPSATLPWRGRITDDMPTRAALEAQLDALDARLRAAPEDAELLGALAKATLDLGRRQVEAGARNAVLLFEDAARAFAKALARQPERYGWCIEAARTAYFQERFADQVGFGHHALRLASRAHAAGQVLPRESGLTWGAAAGRKGGALADERVIEALRWIGDGEARLMQARAGTDPAVELGGMIDALRALGLVAASPFGDAKDWTSLVSLLQSLGLGRAAVVLATAGAQRFPEDRDLRAALNDALWQRGRIDLAAELAAAIARDHPDSADAAWFAGYAGLLVAEDHRRSEAPDLAIRAYERAAAAFARAAELRASYAANCAYYVACTWFGRGMAHLLADRRQRAADCLVRAVEAAPAVAQAKDGLGREPVDLVDQALEWRATGPSPVDPAALLDALQAADPDHATWAIAVSDAELREALRADGRNPVRVERETVDAGGQPIRMLMGLPTKEGDAHLRASIEAGRRAAQHGETAENRHPLAQSATIWAERMLQRLRDGDGAPEDRLAAAREGLAEAAPLLGLEPPAAGAGRAALEELARDLREKLGPARPRLREGR